MSIFIKNALIEGHLFISMLKHYHGTLQQINFIINTHIPYIKSDLAFLGFFIAMNNLISLNQLVFILLVLDASGKIIELNVQSLFLTQDSMTIKKPIDEVKKYTASQKINNVLNICNKLSIAFVHDLVINLPVFVH